MKVFIFYRVLLIFKKLFAHVGTHQTLFAYEVEGYRAIVEVTSKSIMGWMVLFTFFLGVWSF